MERNSIRGHEAAGGGGVVAGTEVVEVGFEVVVLAGEVQWTVVGAEAEGVIEPVAELERRSSAARSAANGRQSGEGLACS